MKNSKKQFKETLLYLFELVAGLMIVVNSKAFAKVFIAIAGIGLILLGLLQVIRYYQADPVTAAKKNYLTKGLLALSAGCFCAFRANWFLNVLPSFSFLLGVGIFTVGLMKIQRAMDMTRMDNQQWYLSFIGAAVSLACAAILLSGSSSAGKFLWFCAGILLILEGAADIALLFMGKFPKKPKAAEPAQEEIPAEETPVEEFNL